MPAPAAELRRGRIFYALFPFVPRFPVTLEDGRNIESVEAFAASARGTPMSLLSRGRLRPVLLLHDGTRGEHGDVVCLRITTVKPRHRRDAAVWSRVVRGEHAFVFHLPVLPRYGLPEESVIALPSIGAVHKSAVLGPRHVGELSVRDMQAISERLRLVLSLDLAPLIAAQANELLRRAGLDV